MSELTNMEFNITILTLNIWGIPFVSKDRQIRVEAIANHLAEGEYDVVSLQEVWSKNDFHYIRDHTKNIFPYSHYFHSGVFGSGLCILSKYPITMTLFHAWSVNGYIHRIQHGDWFGGKGVGLCKLSVNGIPVNIYIAHLHAEYNRENDEYKAHRIIQAYDTAQFIETTRGDAALQILAGDLNTEPNDLAFKILLSVSKLIDSGLNTVEGTNECITNTYTALNSNSDQPNGKRIDYILYRTNGDVNGSNMNINLLKYFLPLSKNIPKYKSCSYSDHEGVASTFLMINNHKCDNKINKSYDNNPKILIPLLTDCIQVCNDYLLNLQSHRNFYFAMAMAVLILLFTIMDFVAPIGFKWLFIIFRLLLAFCILFFTLMASLWNSTEANAIVSGKLAMEISLKHAESLEFNLDLANK